MYQSILDFGVQQRETIKKSEENRSKTKRTVYIQ